MRTRLVAALEVLLIFPAALFMGALVVRELPGPTHAAQQVVIWYAGRIWTLWILLLALPSAVVATGCATLLRRGNGGIVPRETLLLVRTQPAALLVATTALAAVVILVIVVLHMAAN